jgi:hypothetical protein
MAKRKVGKPPINDPEDVQAIQAKIDAYFDGLGEYGFPTFCGLALALGYTSRQSLWENSTKDIMISLPIKIALLKVEETYERGLRGPAPTGCIFALKNRGWTDKQEIEHSGSVTIIDDIR